MKAWIREPAVAGRFYPDSPLELREVVSAFLADRAAEPVAVTGIMVPHAGYIYSGRFAASVYQRAAIPDTVVLLCPNHTGKGRAISVWSRGHWVTPLGVVPVDEVFSEELLATLGEEGDQQAHRFEHANEVQLPFLQVLNANVRIVAVTLGALSLDRCLTVGKALAKVIAGRAKGSVLCLASTDMSHYVSAAEAKQKDSLALEAVKRLSALGLYETVGKHEISMCGFIPTTAVISACLALGAKNGEILSYGHSGEVTGDERSVVAYAGAQFI